MATIVPVEADVRIQSTANVSAIQYGEAVTAGDFCYVSTVDGKAYKSSALSQGEAYVTGIALATVGLDDFGAFTTGLNQAVDLGVAAATAELYVLSQTPGQIMPYSDLVAGDWICYASIGDENNLFTLKNQPVGLQKV